MNKQTNPLMLKLTQSFLGCVFGITLDIKDTVLL